MKIPITNGVGKPFNISGNNFLGGDGSGHPRGGNNRPPWDQNLRSYAIRLTWLWIGPTWNLWYPPWYPIQPPIVLNIFPSRKSLPYPVYTTQMDPDAHVWVFCKAIHANGEKHDANIINLFYFMLCDGISKWGDNFMKAHPVCKFEELEVAFYNHYQKVQTNE